MTAADPRLALARKALAEIPRLLTLMDRTPVSPTYGCLDRAYWHFRMMDFANGMSQKEVLPLALVWSMDLPGNIWFQQPNVREWIIAGIRFAARDAHADGSCDDYYPFERAAGAAAFSLLAFLEATDIIGLHGDPELDAFLKKRAHWLASHEESGRLSNHEALIANCLERMSARFGEEWDAPMRRRLERLKSWQSEEGWFDEYGGADPGYLTLTIAQLADLDRRRPDLELRPAIERAVRFLHHMVHPDGTLGGEYTSRTTLNYFPHGLEIAGAWLPLATAINDRCLAVLAEDRNPSVSDDRLFAHHPTAWLLTLREWQAARVGPVPMSEGGHFRAARLLIRDQGDTRLYLGTTRGGAFRLFRDGKLVLADTGPSFRLKNGKVAVTHIEGPYEVAVAKDRIRITGAMAWAKSARLTPYKSIVLRGVMLTVGRFFPDLIRRLLQGMLVTGRKDAPFRFVRELVWEGAGWTVRDEVVAARGWDAVEVMGIYGFQSSLTTVVARVWQPEQLQPWVDLTAQVRGLNAGEPLVVERRV